MDSFFKELFYGTNISIHGTEAQPLFNGANIGGFFGDNNARRNISRMPAEYFSILTLKHMNNNMNNVLFLTEKGLYHYILNSRSKAAQQYKIKLLGALCDLRKTHDRADIFFEELFFNTNIHLYGGPENDPLFASFEIGKFFNDPNINTSIKRMPTEYIYTSYLMRSDNTIRNTLFLTEEGLYYHILYSHTTAVLQYRGKLIDLLCKIRGQYIDSEIMEDKIDRNINQPKGKTITIRDLYDDSAEDASAADMCEFYVNRYVTLRKIQRDRIHDDIVELLYGEAVQYFREDQYAFRLIVVQTLDEYLHAKPLAGGKRPRED